MTRSAQEIWETALGELQVQVSKPNYRTWFEKTAGISYQDNRFTVSVPNTFVAEYLDRNQRSLIEKTLISLTGGDVQVEFQVNGRHQTARAASASLVEPRFNPRYVFESFIEGASNRLARTAALAVAQNPGRSYNPLFIYGGPGLGKTHLLHAIGHAALTTSLPVVAVSGEQFTNEFVSAVRERKTEEFRGKYRGAGMLLIDDVHFIGGKEQTEESFFHTFNELHNANRQLVITADRPPHALPLFGEKLRSRFEWGLTVDIQPPDFATRLAILEEKARSGEVDITPAVLEFIGKQIKQNIRELEGSLNRVIAYARLLKSLPTIDMAARALEDIGTKPPAETRPAPARLIELVASAFQLTPEDIIGPRRDKEACLARRVAMYILRQETGGSLAQIGQELGGRDAAAVTNACKKVASDITSNPYLRQKTGAIQAKLHGSAG